MLLCAPKKGFPESAVDHASSHVDRSSDLLLVTELRVDLCQIHGDETVRLCDKLANERSFAEGEASHLLL